jgi:hypothetical protein
LGVRQSHATYQLRFRKNAGQQHAKDARRRRLFGVAELVDRRQQVGK